MPQDTAISLWRLLFSVKPWPLLDAWCAFLEQHHNRAVSRDTWIQLLDFCRVRVPLVLFSSNSFKVSMCLVHHWHCIYSAKQSFLPIWRSHCLVCLASMHLSFHEYWRGLYCAVALMMTALVSCAGSQRGPVKFRGEWERVAVPS